MTGRASRFGRGTAVYACNVCTRKTRQTGGDNHRVGLCEECWEIAGHVNSLSDNGPDWEYREETIQEIARLTAQCIAKGGKREQS